ncbi:NAD(P)H-dependent oxidoreductase [Variovorax sp. J22G73]|uniref:FMN-dependent NADH-azoreductase n=1 Tax=unclassified Variovorax TaxID=663243 RepID=UPI002577479C|nr:MULTISPECIES: NAD(P)H-dependent oxidoreductase [unclassified Variovorax]MDM0003144.1 NAD(P)H-dependent oxidoreductase [Variovorax sp. J22R203]MDM0097190.1 NAD(P)H-dependent oxidoreductase [Variovorax sp. J22G73]
MKTPNLHLLHIDSSARPGRSGTDPHGSHTRRLSARFVERWRHARPGDTVEHLDVGQHPPAHVDGRWIHAAFTPQAAREPWMTQALAESDRLVDQLIAADVIVIGLPMYNFSVPAQFKAWIDNIVRVGRTFGFDRSRGAVPYWPLLADAGKRVVLLGARGDHGYDAGGRAAHLNHAEASVRSALGYIGITDVFEAAVESDEFGGEQLAQSLRRAESRVDELADFLLRSAMRRQAPGHAVLSGSVSASASGAQA